jgi:hypothetical protein
VHGLSFACLAPVVPSTYDHHGGGAPDPAVTKRRSAVFVQRRTEAITSVVGLAVHRTANSVIESEKYLVH